MFLKYFLRYLFGVLIIYIIGTVMVTTPFSSTYMVKLLKEEYHEELGELVKCMEELQKARSKENTLKPKSSAMSKYCREMLSLFVLSDISNSNDNSVKLIDQKQGCYENLDVQSERTYMFDDRLNARKNYLQSFRMCGHNPRGVSKRMFPIEDDVTLPVPNVVHYVWCKRKNKPIGSFTFQFYIALFSVSKKIKPRYILWHGDAEPTGYWWNKTLHEIPNIYFVKWKCPREVFGLDLKRVQFFSDVLRLHILIVHGGIYLDQDLLITKSFEPLRQYPLTLGREMRYTLANGVILVKPWSMFLRVWLDMYRSFKPYNWAKSSMMAPNKLSTLFEDSIHIEANTLVYPTWPHVTKLYFNTFDWSKSYSVHIFGEELFGHLLPKSLAEMDKSNITLAYIMREIYYGDKRIRGNSSHT